MLHVWNIYLHLPQKWPSYVGKYSSTMVRIWEPFWLKKNIFLSNGFIPSHESHPIYPIDGFRCVKSDSLSSSSVALVGGIFHEISQATTDLRISPLKNGAIFGLAHVPQKLATSNPRCSMCGIFTYIWVIFRYF